MDEHEQDSGGQAAVAERTEGSVNEQTAATGEGSGGAALASEGGQGRTALERVRATVGRTLLVHGPDQFDRVRPGTVVLEHASGLVDVNLELHGELDAYLCGGAPGMVANTAISVPVYEPLDDEQRADLIAAIKRGADVRPFWAEFPRRV